MENRQASPQLHPDRPQPSRSRWQPLRIGLVELFHYDTEEFWFREGHLLLRGNNGTGKSKVLALTLPFLLDGDTSAHRVEPDGDAKKRMDWNLLLGGRYDDRTGYAWIEFGRHDDAGARQFLTLVCGMRAVAGKGVVDKWFLVTDQRMGEGLHLVDRSGIVLGKDRLRDGLGDRATLLDRDEDYRRLVNERLVGLAQHRYDALLTLLVQLRQPQLSKRPDMTALNRALTEALPPLPAAVIADVAEAMRTLERERQDLADLQQARGAVGRFDRGYQTYAAIAAVRRADDVRQMTATYEETGRELGTAQRERDTAAAEADALAAQESALRARIRELAAREQTLRDSPEMRDARRLDDARRRAEETTAQAERAEGHSAEAAERLAEQRRRRIAAVARHDEARDEVESVRSQVHSAASSSGLGPGRPDGDALAVALTTGDDATAANMLRRRRDALDHVAGLTTEADHAQAAHAAARAELDRTTSVRDDAAEAHRTVIQQQRRRLDDWVDTLLRVAADWTALSADGLDPAVAAAAEWAQTTDGPNPVDRFAQQAARVVEADITRERAGIEVVRAEIEAERQTADDALAALAEGAQPAPSPLPTRPADHRANRAGAPLWQLIDFADHVDPDDRAGLEAALEGAGLLDAWVTPDGGLLEADSLDVAITIGQAPAEVSMADVLRPAAVAPDGAAPPVDDAVVTDILARIGLGEGRGTTWIDVTGRFRIGVAAGAWRKPQASFVGWAARESARTRRIGEVTGRRDELLASLADLDRRSGLLDDRARQLEADLAAVPDDRSVRAASAAVVAAASRLQDAEEQVATAAAAVEQTAEITTAATTSRDDAATELDVPATAEAQDAVGVALGDLRAALAGLWPRRDACDRARQAMVDARQDVERAQDAADTHQQETEQAIAVRDEAVTTYQTLAEMVGESADRVVRALADAERRRQQSEQDADDCRTKATQAGERRAKADGRVELLERRHAERRDERAGAVDALRRLAGTGLVEAALSSTGDLPEDRVVVPDPSTQWAADPGVRLARDLRRVFPDVDAGDQAWDRAGSAITTSLNDLERTLAAQGARTWSELREGALIVGVHFSGQDFAVHRLGGVLDDRLEDRRRLLDAREQQILEDHLVTEIAAQLAQLIGDAERQVNRMNQELTDRPTSTGMVVRLRWRPDPVEGPVGLKEALGRLLRQSSGAWSDDDRRALGAFLQAEIQRRRSENEAGTWTEHLTQAFDYRQWHHFQVERRQGDGTWRSAGSPASGGERALTVTLPLFAAAAAHYSSAWDHAPRLVLLDEAFAGVDDDARRQCLGLLATFDLDYVLTSEREWGCYPEVPGLSICHLVRRDDVDAVYVSRWEWDGITSQPHDRPADSAREQAPATVGGGLFDEDP